MKFFKRNLIFSALAAFLPFTAVQYSYCDDPAGTNAQDNKIPLSDDQGKAGGSDSGAHLTSTDISPEIIVFGDSMSDTGNNNWLISDGRKGEMRGSPVVNWPLWKSESPVVGKNWVTFMAEEYKGRSWVVNTFEQWQKDKNGGILNAAYASAETGRLYLNDIGKYPVRADGCYYPGLHPEYSCVPGMLEQIRLVFDSIGRDYSGDVFIFGGANDIFDNIEKFFGHFKTRSDDDQAHLYESAKNAASNDEFETLFELVKSPFHKNKYDYSHPLENLNQAVKNIANTQTKGKIVVIGLPDLGEIPDLHQYPTVFASDIVSFFCRAFNNRLKANIKELNNPSVQFVDITNWQDGEVKSDVWAKDPLKNTCLSLNKQENCISDDGKPILFFDGKHPTEKGHESLWKYIQSQLQKSEAGNSVEPPKAEEPTNTETKAAGQENKETHTNTVDQAKPAN